MRTISTGEPSTLKTYRVIAMTLGTMIGVSEDTNKALKFIDDKIAESPNGENEEVVMDESQALFLLTSLLGIGNG